MRRKSMLFSLLTFQIDFDIMFLEHRIQLSLFVSQLQV